MNKEEVLKGALALNGNDKNYTISLDGDRIIMQVKWMDAVHFAPDAVTDEMRSFSFSVTLGQDGTYTELDQAQKRSAEFTAGGLSGSYSSFKGTQISFNKTISFSKDRSSGETGVNAYTFSSEEFKKPLRDYLAQCGWTKAKKGFWKTLFGG